MTQVAPHDFDLNGSNPHSYKSDGLLRNTIANIQHICLAMIRLGADFVDRLDIGHQGAYSEIRLRNFAEYLQTTSEIRAIMVCISTPLPVWIFILMLDSIPLGNPCDWPYNNFGAWLRLTLTVFAFQTYSLSGVKTCIPWYNMNWSRTTLSMISVTILTQCVNVYLAISLTQNAINPLNIAGAIAMLHCLIIAIRIRTSHSYISDPLLSIQLIDFAKLMLIGALNGVYFAVFKVYKTTSSITQAIVIISLPFVKVLLRNLVAYILSDVARLPMLVVFCIDLCHIIFVSICIQTSMSIVPALLVVVAETLHNQMNLFEILTNVESIWSIQQDSKFSVSRNEKNLIEMTLILYDKVIPTELLNENTHKSSSSVVGGDKVVNPDHKHLRLTRAINYSRELFFQCEYVMLVEYAEVFIPLLHLTHLIAVVWLPYTKYIDTVKLMTYSDVVSTVGSLFMYGFIQLFSLMILIRKIQAQFQFSPLYILAYALETEFLLIQSALFSYIPMFVLSPLAHMHPKQSGC